MKNLIFVLLFVSIALISKAQHSIDGYVFYNSSSGFPVSDVTLKLKNTSNGNFVGNPFVTDATGYFKFENILDGKYTISCSTTHEVGGITPVDALMVNRSYIRLYTFPDNLKKLAANVNGDTKTNPVDALLINRRYIKLINSFNAGEWLFAQDTITVIGSNVTHNINALCYGDVNGSYTCPQLNAPGAGGNVPSQEQIIWNWLTVSGAIGYKYNTTNNYATATNNGTSTSLTQSGLSCNTSYTLYVWTYNSCGVSPVLTLTQSTSKCPLTCGFDVIDSRDNKTYHTVPIGTQCWMKENLSAVKYMNGDDIPNVTNNTSWSGLITGAYCNYNNDVNNVATYGRLYNWYAVTDSRKICPTGWHVPSSDDMTTMERSVCGGGTDCETAFPYDIITIGWRGSYEGDALKEAGTTHWLAPNSGSNSSEFTALPSGVRKNGPFVYLTTYFFFWNTNEYNAANGLYRNLGANRNIDRYYYPKYYGLAVRCLKD